MISFTFVYGQKSIDALFDKYAGKEGFTTVTLNGNLLKLVKCFDDDKKDSKIPDGLAEIRILTQEDKTMNIGSFYDMVIQDIDISKYEEIMRVRESDQDVRMLVRTEGRRFKEFLLIAGGSDNALIQIKGDISIEEARKLTEEVHVN
jgi:hypothetical protein